MFFFHITNTAKNNLKDVMSVAEFNGVKNELMQLSEKEIGFRRLRLDFFYGAIILSIVITVSIKQSCNIRVFWGTLNVKTLLII